MSGLVRALIAAGLLLVALGLLIHGLPSLPLGRLPGDIRIERPGVRIYLPLASCLVASAALSALFWLFSKWR